MSCQKLFTNGCVAGVARPSLSGQVARFQASLGGTRLQPIVLSRSQSLITKRRGNLSVVKCTAQPTTQDQVIPNYSGPIVPVEKINEWFTAFNLDYDMSSCVKIVISGRSVGSVIGMGGQRCQSLQELHSVKIFVTTAGDFVPGTRQRLFQVSGKLGDCIVVLSELIADIAEPVVDDMGQEQIGIKKVSTAFPITIVGKLFGEGGSMVKNIMHITGATISAESQEHMMAMQDIRRFDIVGGLEQILQAYIGLLALCAAEDTYSEFSQQLPTMHTDSQWLPRWLATLPRNSALMSANYNVQVGVPDSFVPRLIGKNATNLIRLLQASGNAQIDIPRDEFVEGTDLRKVVIRGNFKDVMKAQAGLDKMIKESIRNGFLDPSQFGSRVYNGGNIRGNNRRR
eukprot:TRINITY_DN28291_c0_g1_i1.p1 TRINITY_DN28291_c0_g1~~TRINITY_DN28291_c0_g1_i1.p1  ORF type:complete len:444 (+),score=39.90 TRINITY_DN28291_c0_g1_i1:140-1333(+)